MPQSGDNLLDRSPVEGFRATEEVYVSGERQIVDRLEKYAAARRRGCGPAGHQRDGRAGGDDRGCDEEFIDPVRDVEGPPRVNGNSLQSRHERKSVLD